MNISPSSKNEHTELVVHNSVGRREALKKAAAMLGGLTATAVLPAMGTEETPRRAPAAVHTSSVVAKDGAPVIDTLGGRVIGYVRNGISTFKGIPYGESTDGANRFMPPSKPKPWSGVRSSRQYGDVAPQAARTGWANDEEAFVFSWDDGIQGEDCLRVNVWTPGINDQKKRPVMVWLHGGGFAAGSGQELKSYDGENLARRGDVVVVTLNHRLNILGYLDLSQYGERYARSANVDWFTWQTPILSGRPRAFHCAEIPFVFDNTDRCENMTGGGADARALAAVMSDAWIQFARTGNPNHARMPRWEAHSPSQNQTMIFDNHSFLVNAPDAEEQKSIADA